MINIDVTELKQLETFFDGLNRRDQKKIIISSYRKAVRPLLAAARANLVGHNKSFGIYRSMGTIEDKNYIAIDVGSKTNTRTVRRSGGRNYISKVWYAHLLEKGTVERIQRRQSFRKGAKIRGTHAGKSTGRMPATHFFENAYNQTENQIIGSYTRTVRDFISSEEDTDLWNSFWGAMKL